MFAYAIRATKKEVFMVDNRKRSQKIS